MANKNNKNNKKNNNALPQKNVSGKDSFVQFLKFTLLSLSAGLIETISFLLLENFTSLSYLHTHAISLILSVIWNFTLNRRYTFKSANNIPRAMVKVAFFYVIFLPVTAYFGQLASTKGINDYIIKAITLALNFVGEFLWWKFVVFKGSEYTNDIAEKELEKKNS